MDIAASSVVLSEISSVLSHGRLTSIPRGLRLRHARMSTMGRSCDERRQSLEKRHVMLQSSPVVHCSAQRARSQHWRDAFVLERRCLVCTFARVGCERRSSVTHLASASCRHSVRGEGLGKHPSNLLESSVAGKPTCFEILIHEHVCNNSGSNQANWHDVLLGAGSLTLCPHFLPAILEYVRLLAVGGSRCQGSVVCPFLAPRGCKRWYNKCAKPAR